MTAFRLHSKSLIGPGLAAASILAFLVLLMLINAAQGGEAYCDACNGESWDPQAKLDEIGNASAGETEVMAGLSTAQKNRVGIWKQTLSGFSDSDAANASKSANASNKAESLTEEKSSAKESSSGKTNSSQSPENASIVRSAKAKAMLAPMDELSGSEIILDVSENATRHIQGSIAIPYTEFMNGTAVRSIEELEAILGEAGISRGDAVIIYGECLPCGGGPNPATFVYWIMKSLGHENVRVLDGMVSDWEAAGKPVSEDVAVLPTKSYIATVNSNYTANYELVSSGGAQIVDARTTLEYGEGSIAGALNYPYESVITDNRIKDESKLLRVFSFLDKSQPVIVYSNTGFKASVVWFALALLGCNARLYSFED